jgi:hypothetical protein
MRSLHKIFLLLLVTVISASLLGQSDSARLVGTITDASGAVSPGATVTVTNLGTGRIVSVQTNASGEYVVTELQAGRYHVEVRQTGFKTSTADLTLEVSQIQQISLQLQAGAVDTTVNVSAEVPLVDTSTSSLGEVIQGRQVTELPLNGRNFTQLALLTPGVTRGAYGDIASGGSSGTNAETFRNSETGGAALSANGLRPQANNFILDGVDNNEGLVNSIVFFPPAEAIQEFRVNTSVAPAEFGRAGGVIVQTSIKSGTNQIHGSAFLFRRSGEFDAHAYGTTGPIVFRQNQFGGTLGGAVWKNKLFLFGDYQGRRQDQPEGVEFATVPTDKMRTGDFSELLGTTLTSTPACNTNAAWVGKGYIFDPITCTPFGWNGTTATNIITNPNPVGLKYLQGFPEPNIAGVTLENFRAQRQSIRNFDDFDIRADFAASERDSLFFRYSFGNDNFTVTNRLGPNNPSGFGSGDNINHPRGAAAGYTRTFGQNLVNDFRFGYIDTNYGYNPPNIGQALAQQIGIPGSNPVPLLGGQALIGGNNTELEYQGDGGPYNVPQKLYQFVDSVSYVHGHHVFKFGANIGKRNVNFVQGNDAKGYFVIGGVNFPGTGRFTGYEPSELLAGFVDYEIGQFQGLYQTRSWETGYFAQDDWRVNSRLTLNLGLRYDFYTWPYEIHNLQSNWDPTNGTLVVPGTPGWPRSLVDNDKNNFAPRVGFAYNLDGNGKTVVRGGYGIFYFLDRGGVGNQLSNNPDFNGISTYQACPSTNNINNCADPTGARVTLSGQGPAGNNDWTLATAALPAPVNNVDINAPTHVNVIYVPRDSPNSSVQQWNIGVERSLGADTALNVAYVGTKMDNLATGFNANAVPLGGTTPRWPSLVGNVNEYADIGSGRYNGLQVQLNHRMSAGLQFTTAYTYSHTTDNSNGAFSTTTGGARIFVDANANPLLNLNQGNSDGDIRNYFVFSSLYELPFGKGRAYGSNISRGLDYVLGGWQWNNIITLSSGTPLDLSVSGLNVSPAERPDVSGHVSAKIVGNQGVISGSFSCPPTTGINCFTTPTGSFSQPGNLARNAIYGPGYHSWDMGMVKDFKIGERFTTQFRAEVFNLFNTPQFQNGSFNQAINMPTGTSTGDTQNAQTRFQSERQLQLVVRITF